MTSFKIDTADAEQRALALKLDALNKAITYLPASATEAHAAIDREIAETFETLKARKVTYAAMRAACKPATPARLA